MEEETFDIESVVLSEEKEKTIVDSLIDEIAEKTGKSYQEVISMINERQEKLSNLLSFEVVTLIIAKEMGIDISKYIDKVEELVFK